MTKKRKRASRLMFKIWNDLIDILYSIQTGHPGGSLSCLKLLQLFISTRWI